MLACRVRCSPGEGTSPACQQPHFGNNAIRSIAFDFTSPAELLVTEHLFIGREHERAWLESHLQAGGCVVLSGLGGIGKTALAQEAARGMHGHFVGGIVWVNCETRPPLGNIILSAAVVLVGEFARQLRPDEQRQRLEDALRDRPCLLVLDNFESIAEDAEVLRWLKTVRVPSSALIVSRQSVPYLRAPSLKLDELSPDEATELFVQRAHAAGWEGSSEDASIGRLCELVGYLPLAIELVAPRAAELPLNTLIDMVRKNLDALADEKDLSRDERQRSIEACFRISFERLSEEAQALLSRLSILPEGASETVVAGYTEITDWQPPNRGMRPPFSAPVRW